MAITIEAVYENGVLKPAQPLPLKEHEKVRIIVKQATSRVRQTAGLIGWTGKKKKGTHLFCYSKSCTTETPIASTDWRWRRDFAF